MTAYLNHPRGTIFNFPNSTLDKIMGKKPPQPVVMPKKEGPMIIRASYHLPIGHEANLLGFRGGIWGGKGRKNRGVQKRQALREF
jgi:hypothetical protein